MREQIKSSISGAPARNLGPEAAPGLAADSALGTELDMRRGWGTQLNPPQRSLSFLSSRRQHLKRETQQNLLKRLQSVNKQIAHLITLMTLSLSYCYCQYKEKKKEKR